MEQEIANLIADLSGYTALTDTHGSLTAADLIDKYVDIVNAFLIGDNKLQGGTGDEVMIVSTFCDYLLATAELLLQTTQEEYNFLEVHGALHYGTLLKCNDSYFGSALNLTARIASKASAGGFLCSEEFINAISEKGMYKFMSRGKYNFKNVREEKELFEISLSKPAHLYIDPICRMIVNKEGTSVSHPNKPNILFCSLHCLETYLQHDVLN